MGLSVLLSAGISSSSQEVFNHTSRLTNLLSVRQPHSDSGTKPSLTFTLKEQSLPQSQEKKDANKVNAWK